MQASSVSNGGSRAAKKRAKKKKKQQQQLPETNDAAAMAKPVKKPRVEEPPRPQNSWTTGATVTDNSKVSSLHESKILHFLYPDKATVPENIQSTLEALTTKERARSTLAFLLEPAGITVNQFHEKYWEKKPLLVRASSSAHRHRLDGLLSVESIRQMLHEHPMAYGRDLNVTKYVMDPDTGLQRRLTLDCLPEKDDQGEGAEDGDQGYIEARPGQVWKLFRDGCTVRLLCPHQYADSVQALLSLLEVEWGCMVGANAYLTPPDASQGFAPHYDDIEAFCLQLSGRKRWKVYPPVTGQKLPRVSSEDFTENDLKEMEDPVMDIILSPGDLLYMPRGWIHQACTLEGGSKTTDDGHSLHLTVSAMQQWAWVDLLEELLPEALAAAANSESSTALREGLPRNFLDYMGAIHDDSKESELLKAVKKDDDSKSTDEQQSQYQKARENFRAEAKHRIMRVAKEAMDMVDAACDQMGKQFITSCQPPALLPKEKNLSSLADEKALKILPDMMVRLLRPGIARMVLEEGMAVVYHCVDNSRFYHGRPNSPLEFETDDAPAIEQLFKTLEPQWICVADLYHDTIEDKIGVVQALYDEGILALRQ